MKRVVILVCQQITVNFIRYVSSLHDIESLLVVSYELPLDKTYVYASVIDYAKELKIEVRNPNRITTKLIQEIERNDLSTIDQRIYRL